MNMPEVDELSDREQQEALRRFYLRERSAQISAKALLKFFGKAVLAAAVIWLIVVGVLAL